MSGIRPGPALPVAEKYPGMSFPTVFVDGVLNVAISPVVVKFYLFRFDPSFQGDNTFQSLPVAQVVMPTEGFVASALFMHRHIQLLIDAKAITPERVEELRQIIEAAAP